MMKTNKSYAKRLRVTRTGKIMSRKPGQNHFNAKEGSKSRGAKHGMRAMQIKNKARSRLLVNM